MKKGNTKHKKTFELKNTRFRPKLLWLPQGDSKLTLSDIVSEE